MPRKSKGPYLWFRKERKNKRGKRISKGAWYIIYKRKHIATGCSEREIKSAHEALRDFSRKIYEPPKHAKSIEQIFIADILNIYIRNNSADLGRIKRLNDFWGMMTLSHVNGTSCREYEKTRGNSGGARRDLEDLRAAINFHAKEGLHREIVRVTLPKKGEPKSRWLTRHELAKLLWACWSYSETQKGKKTSKKPLRHLARFVLIAYYTGTRHSAVLKASFTKAKGRSFIDLEQGLFYRLAEGDKPSNKRQPPARLPPRLASHLKRWAKTEDDYIIRWNGKPVKSIKNAFNKACKIAEIEGVTPHTLRHTAATRLMQMGVDKWEAAGFLGMSVEMLERVYGHHHPDFMRQAAAAL